CRETVPHRVRADVFRNTRQASVARNETLNATRCQSTIILGSRRGVVSAIAQEEWREVVEARAEVFLNVVRGRFANEYRSVFLTFTSHHELAAFSVDVVPIKGDQFGNP